MNEDSKILTTARLVLEAIIIEEIAATDSSDVGSLLNALEASFLATFGRESTDVLIEFAKRSHKRVSSLSQRERTELIEKVSAANEHLCSLLQLNTLQERLQFVATVYAALSNPALSGIIKENEHEL